MANRTTKRKYRFLIDYNISELAMFNEASNFPSWLLLLVTCPCLQLDLEWSGNQALLIYFSAKLCGSNGPIWLWRRQKNSWWLQPALRFEEIVYRTHVETYQWCKFLGLCGRCTPETLLPSNSLTLYVPSPCYYWHITKVI